jgi:transposase-like protein
MPFKNQRPWHFLFYELKKAQDIPGKPALFDRLLFDWDGHDLTGVFVPAGVRENPLRRTAGMSIKKYKPEQIVTLLRQIEVEIANGKTTPQACRDAQITAQTYYRWRKEYGGLRLDQAKRLKELEKENAKLKRLVAELSLEKQVLKDVAEGNL